MELLRPAQSKLGRKYGLHPTPRGHRFARTAPMATVGAKYLSAPTGFTCDYRSMMRAPRDQGQEGSCGAHAWAGLKEHNCVQWELDNGGPSAPLGQYLSVAHLYWAIRKAMGTFPEDSGTDNATAASVLQGVGVCPEEFLPYKANPTQAGNAQCNAAALPYRVRQPVTVPLDEPHLDAVLAAKRVIVLGFAVYASFEDTGSDGLVPPVQPGEGLLGGHDVLIVGKRSDGRYIVRNSWGSFADAGHVYMTPAYVAATGWDAWSTA